MLFTYFYLSYNTFAKFNIIRYFCLSKDIKKLIIQKSLLGKLSILQIFKKCHVIEIFVKTVRKYYKKYDILKNLNKKKAGRKSKL